MLKDLQNIFSFTITVEDVVRNLLVAFICGFMVSLFYRWSYRGASYSPAFVSSLISLSMITAVVIMVIGNNLARAFGLVGAMSIIRFRTAVKDTQDIVFIFFALAVGMSAGVGLYVVAIVGTVVIGLITLALAKLNYGVQGRREFLLQFIYRADSAKETPYVKVIENYCRQYKLINIKSLDAGGKVFEISYYVNLKERKRTREFIKALSEVEGVSQVNLFFDEERI